MFSTEIAILSKNHEERFKILQFLKPEYLGVLRISYSYYRRAYTERLSREDAEAVRRKKL